jgi:hypothetical protein
MTPDERLRVAHSGIFNATGPREPPAPIVHRRNHTYLTDAPPPAFLLRKPPFSAPPPKHRYAALVERIEALADCDHGDSRYWRRHYARLRRLLALEGYFT